MGDPFRVDAPSPAHPGVLATLVPSVIERRPRRGLADGFFADKVPWFLRTSGVLATLVPSVTER